MRIALLLASATALVALTSCTAVPNEVDPIPTATIVESPSQEPTPVVPVGASDPTQPAPVFSHGSRQRPQVALTFDADMTEGALQKLTSGRVESYVDQQVIDVLRAKQAPATLFLTGLWMQQYPEVTRDLAADPLFELGTHSWNHEVFVPDCYDLPTLSGTAMDQMTPTQNLLDELAGDRATRLFRFPGACYDEAALAAIGPAGVTAVQFDVAGGDGFQQNAAAIVNTVLDQSQNGSIVVLHLHGGDLVPATGRALPDIIDGLRARGFELVTVGTLMAGVNQ